MSRSGKKTFILIQFLWMLMLFGCAAKKKMLQTGRLPGINTWVCVYSSDASVEQIQRFDLAVLDSDSHPDLARFADSKTLVIGYLSLGEVGDYRWYWQAIAGKDWILDENPNWQSRMIDIRDPEWQALLVKKVIPKILAKGFDGLFLDTIDNAEYLERYHPKKKYPGAEAAMTGLIRSIRESFPSIYLIANRGFAILNDISTSIDAVVAESVFTTIDFKQKTTRRRSPDEFEPIVRQLQKISKTSGLKVFTLDYAGVENQSDVAALISKSRALGFVPYVSTPKLDTVYTFTLN